MLADSLATTILPATDLQRARRFYADTLGLKPMGEEDGTLVLKAGGGTCIELQQREQATKAEHTALTFEVSDLEGEVADLERRGVRFEDYDLPGLKTERHVARIGSAKAAWFKDTEGNILCVHQR